MQIFITNYIYKQERYLMNLKNYFSCIILFTQCNNLISQKIITNEYLYDGFGSQFQNIIATAVFAELNNKKFVYSPFREMQHNYDNDPDFIKKKEDLINFIGNFDLNTNYDAHQQTNCKSFFDNNVTKCAKTKILKKIKLIFRKNKDYKNYFDPKYLNIAIHIRRFNQNDIRIEGSDVPNGYFKKIMGRLKNKHRQKKLIFHIYSQGEEINFSELQGENVVFHLNKSIEETFASMVLADILVTSAGSFSYAAALISSGIVYYRPFWHNPLPHWINTSNFD